MTLDKLQLLAKAHHAGIHVFFSVVFVGTLSQLGVPALVMLHTVIDGQYEGQVELIIEPEGGVRLKMDNRQGHCPPENNQTEQLQKKHS
jgi:hypothetical protein